VDAATPKPWIDALQWVMTQPGLLQGLPGGSSPLLTVDDPRLVSLIEHTKNNSEEFISRIKKPQHHKIGIVFETLLEWGLEVAMGRKCIARDIQVRENKRTIGALDLILAAPSGGHEHWELAFKIYLQSDDNVQWASWLGPMRRDRLDKKVRRMLEHQLPLSTTPAGQQVLKTLGVGSISQHRIILQGILFSPWGKPSQPAFKANLPPQGRWLRPSQVPCLIQQRKNSRWVLRKRPLWFGPWSGDSHLADDDFHQQAGSHDIDRAQLWNRLACTKHPKEEQFIIVPEEWGSGVSA